MFELLRNGRDLESLIVLRRAEATIAAAVQLLKESLDRLSLFRLTLSSVGIDAETENTNPPAAIATAAQSPLRVRFSIEGTFATSMRCRQYSRSARQPRLAGILWNDWPWPGD